MTFKEQVWTLDTNISYQFTQMAILGNHNQVCSDVETIIHDWDYFVLTSHSLTSHSVPS